MGRRLRDCAIAVLLALAWTAPAAAQPVGTAFTYQGRLDDGGSPAAGDYDFQFSLFDAPTGGLPVGSPATLDDVTVVDGLFTVSLDFGAVFAGNKRWIEVAVRPGASTGGYTTLSPRQELTPSPNAVFSSSVPWTGISGLPAGFADNIDNDVLGGLSCANNQVAKWNGAAWACAPDQDTTYSAGAGLTLAGTVLSIADLGVTTAKLADSAVTSVKVQDGAIATADLADNSVAVAKIADSAVTSAKIADATIALADLGQNGCGSGQVMKWSGTAWACATDSDSGGDITAVTAGTGLAGGGTSGAVSVAVDPAVVQSRVGGTCAAGSSIRIVNSDGTVVCEPDDAGGWALSGNAATDPTINFLGTTDDQPLELRVNGVRVLRLEPWPAGSPSLAPNVIAGNASNGVTAGVVGAAIGGGGAGVSGGNRVTDQWGTVAGGMGNLAGDDAGTTDDNGFATIGGGQGNRASQYATVSGGLANAAGPSATVAGGSFNVASGLHSTVAGGNNNYAQGDFSFAAGFGAFIRDPVQTGTPGGDSGTFVWSDATPGGFVSTGSNQFLVRASGGVGINTNAPTSTLDVAGTTTMAGFRLTTGPGAGFLLTSDAAGAGTWQPAPSSLPASCGVGQVVRWDGTAWACADAGDIDAVNTPASGGLEGGVGSGDASLSLLTSCGGGQILKWSGSAWACAADADSGDITAVTAGTGLSGGGTSGDVTLSVDAAVVQSRVGGTCTPGSSIRIVNADGTVVCEADDDSGGDITSVMGTLGISGGATSGDVSLSIDPNYRLPYPLCQAGQFVTWTGSNWDCTANPGTSKWDLLGNAGVNENFFLGSTNNAAVNFRVNNQRAFRLVPGTAPSVVGGHGENMLQTNVIGATIAGGGESGGFHFVSDNFGTVGGGRLSLAGDGGVDPTDQPYATVAGGNFNQAGGRASSVGGGDSNWATGDYSTIPGGRQNQAAGATSFAAGQRAKSMHDGAFVWADGQPSDFSSSGTNQFLVRAQGGVGINTNAPVPGIALDVAGTIRMSGFQLTTAPAAGRVLTSDASGNGTWQPGGGDITGVAAGTGLTGGGTSGDVTLDVDTTLIQSRVTGSCAPGSSIRTVSQDGTVVCEIDDNASGWSLTGNAGTNPATDFIGTTDSQPVELRVNGQRALRVEHVIAVPNVYEGHNVLAGHHTNAITSGVTMATIAGGGGLIVGVPWSNQVTDIAGTVGGGTNNRAGDGAGSVLDITGATVSGGDSNVASGTFSTVPGGQDNEAGGTLSLAAGQGAKVRTPAQVGGGDTDGDEGTFVWADASTFAGFFSSGPNQFLIRAAGGVGINTNTPAAGRALTVNGRGDITASAPQFGAVLTAINTNAAALTYGVWGQSNGSGIGVVGSANSTSGGIGVFGQATSTSGGIGVYGSASSPNHAGLFDGRVQVNGNLNVVGTLTKSSGSFKIDHPLDPESKYLYHSFVESPDMKNIYDGIVTTDPEGYATVDMPDWFNVLNRDFRYQLTVVGNGDWARARVAKEIEGNRFVIQTDLPNIKVSWQVTGIRQDAFANAHRIPLEEDKPESEHGTCMHPEACGRAGADTPGSRP